MTTKPKTTTPKTPQEKPFALPETDHLPIKLKNQQEKPFVLPETGYIRINQLLKIIPFSASTIWRKVKSGDFPTAYRLSDKVTAFKIEEVRAWMKSKEAA